MVLPADIRLMQLTAQVLWVVLAALVLAVCIALLLLRKVRASEANVVVMCAC